MIKIKEQVVDSEDVFEAVLSEVFGNNATYIDICFAILNYLDLQYEEVKNYCGGRYL